MLTDINGLAMNEVVGDFTGQKLGATFFRGSTQSMVSGQLLILLLLVLVSCPVAIELEIIECL